MKKLFALICLAMALVSASALSAEADTEPSLWPACDPNTGLWGYINARGEWGIVPQYAWANHFHDGCAIVNVDDQGVDGNPCTEGIIDETGAFLLPPEYILFDFCDDIYGVDEVYFVMGDGADEAMMGWFNIPNRFFSGLHWYEVTGWEDCPYVEVREGNADARMGLADRATGAMAVPAEYSHTGLYARDVEDGFLVAERADTGACELIEIGRGVVALPEGVTVDYGDGVSEGLLPFVRDGLYGYLNTAGEIVIDAQFDTACAFWDGYAQVTLPGEDEPCIIDRQGQTLMLLEDCGDPYDTGYGGVVDGALFILREDRSWSLVDPDGTERCRHQIPKGMYNPWLYEEAPDGPIFVQYDLSDCEEAWALLSRGDYVLTGPRWSDRSAPDAQGWMAARDMDGLWGFINRYGNTVLPFAFTWAMPFEGELAFVRWRNADGERMEGYINRGGEVVYQWQALDDDAGYPIDQC